MIRKRIVRWGLLLLVLLSNTLLTASGSAQSVLQALIQVGDDAKRLQRARGIIGMDDVNNDGWPDLAVGVYTLRRTYVYFGGPGILDTAADVEIQGAGAIHRIRNHIQTNEHGCNNVTNNTYGLLAYEGSYLEGEYARFVHPDMHNVFAPLHLVN